jgi:signal transduction histidine kinase
MVYNIIVESGTMKEKERTVDRREKTGDYAFMFQKEMQLFSRSQKVLETPGLPPNELKEEYRLLSGEYNKLVKGMMKITSVGDKNYKKLMNANEKIQEQKDELELLNRQLRDANAAKNKIYSIIAHDLRNPLQFLLFSSDMLGSEYEENEKKLEEKKVKEFIEKVFKTAQNMSGLLENLLQWARSQSGKIECRPRSIDLHKLAAGAIDYFHQNAEKKDIRLFSLIPQGTWGFADEDMIKSVLRNLVSNAIKFTPPGGTVKLSVSGEEKFIRTAVSDTGTGIPAEKLETLFQLGKENSTLGTSGEKGSGLGLLLCKQFVEMNGGKIYVQSQPAKGSIFEFSLPKP